MRIDDLWLLQRRGVSNRERNQRPPYPNARNDIRASVRTDAHLDNAQVGGRILPPDDHGETWNEKPKQVATLAFTLTLSA